MKLNTRRVSPHFLALAVVTALTSFAFAYTMTATPKFSLPSGTYTGKQYVKLSDGTPGAVIHYTLDGSAPTTKSLVYTGPITVSVSAVIESVAVAPGYANSGLARASYTILRLSPYISPNAVQVTNIQTHTGWKIKYDPGTNGTATGSMALVSSPSLSGEAARFDTLFTYYGGILYSDTYGNDPDAMNFVYDSYVRIKTGSLIANLEMDNNQVAANGDTVIYAFQCAGSAGVWEFGENSGTPQNHKAHWLKSTALCNPAKWTKDTWHHVQISYSRDALGFVTYHSVWLDGAESPINATVLGAFSLGWPVGHLIGNFQVDGTAKTGSSILYLDKYTIYRW